MKRNLLSILILGLLIVNIALTSVMMFSMIGANKKTAKLVDAISTALSLEISDKEKSESAAASIPMTDIEIYNIADSMTIPMKDGDDGVSHYAIVSISFSINTKDPDYKTYGSNLSAQEGLIKSEINSAFGSYTMDEAKKNQEQLKADILSRIQRLYDSEFIFNVSFSEIAFQ